MEDTETPAASSPASTTVKQSSRGLLYVCVAVFFFSTSPIVVRWSAPFNAFEIAFWRLAIAALLVAALGIITRQRLLLKRQEVPRFIFYGFVTALHFLFYVASLSFTTIAHSLALIYTSPIFVTLFSAIVLREPLPVRKYASIGVAVIGVAIMVGFEPHYTTCSLHGQCMLLGDGMALLAGLCFAIYSVARQGEPDRHPLFRYTTNVHGLAALWLLPVVPLFPSPHADPLTALRAALALCRVP